MQVRWPDKTAVFLLHWLGRSYRVPPVLLLSSWWNDTFFLTLGKFPFCPLPVRFSVYKTHADRCLPVWPCDFTDTDDASDIILPFVRVYVCVCVFINFDFTLPTAVVWLLFLRFTNWYVRILVTLWLPQLNRNQWARRSHRLFFYVMRGLRSAP